MTSDAIVEQAIACYVAGVPVIEIARVCGVSPTYVGRWAREGGVPPRLPGRPSGEWCPGDAGWDELMELCDLTEPAGPVRWEPFSLPANTPIEQRPSWAGRGAP